MKIVLDTNVAVSGLLWKGTPGRILELAAAGQLVLLATAPMLAEVDRVLGYPKFWKRLALLGTKVPEALAAYHKLTQPVTPVCLPDAGVERDPTDNIFLEAGLGGGAAIVVTGDEHLLELKSYCGMALLNPTQFLELLDRLAQQS